LNAKKSITQEVWNAHFIIEDSCIKGDLLFTNSPLHCIYILKTAITSQFYIKMLWLVFCILLILYGELWQSYVFCLYCMVSCDSHMYSVYIVWWAVTVIMFLINSGLFLVLYKTLHYLIFVYRNVTIYSLRYFTGLQAWLY
jgi:hypothetical protein